MALAILISVSVRGAHFPFSHRDRLLFPQPLAFCNSSCVIPAARRAREIGVSAVRWRGQSLALFFASLYSFSAVPKNFSSAVFRASMALSMVANVPRWTVLPRKVMRAVYVS